LGSSQAVPNKQVFFAQSHPCVQWFSSFYL